MSDPEYFLLNGKKVKREVWNEFRAAIDFAYGSSYGRLNEHIELALKAHTEKLRRKDTSGLKGKGSIVFGPGGD